MSNIAEHINSKDQFNKRHIGPSEHEITSMLKTLNVDSLDTLSDKAVPKSIRIKSDLKLSKAKTEAEALEEIRAIAKKNKIYKSWIGTGYYGTITPPVIQRNILENPGWYTQYTPYQAEISQGRMESLLNFQTMITELTGLDIANASLLDEATACAEAMNLAHSEKNRKGDKYFFIDKNCHPQTINVVETRAEALGVKTMIGDLKTFDFKTPIFGSLVQYPDTEGTIDDLKDFIAKTKSQDALATVAADILALVVLRSPAELGADIAVGSTQRFGVPLGFGGPHAGYFATKDEFKRKIPGRIIGVSIDSNGKKAYRLTLQTREQHIRREKATSNICTAQALLANMAAMYAVYHGPKGLEQIALRVHSMTSVLKTGLKQLGFAVKEGCFFDTIKIMVKDKNFEQVLKFANDQKVNFRRFQDGSLGISLDETTSSCDVMQILEIFNLGAVSFTFEDLSKKSQFGFAPLHKRTTPTLKHEIFNKHHSETLLMRYIKKLESRDLSLTTSMIPLGSCTMKLNAAAELFPVTFPEFSLIHPFAPQEQTQGYLELFKGLEESLCEVTGFDGVSLQPNSGAQGEFAGLLVVKAYQKAQGQGDRDICLIPSSAHGTNPASAALAGLKVVVVKCDDKGNIDVEDLKIKAKQHADKLSVLMVTYPSTHGVFEESIVEICKIVHDCGGQVYMDGANLNAQLGLCKPGEFGPDVSHLNLHKTFSIPHGGGGPGVGPIAVKSHLVKYLPNHPVVKMGGEKGVGAVSQAPWGSASILPISWMYIKMMGADGLKKATQVAILNANYIAKRLDGHYDVLYRGINDMVAHECIIDTRPLKAVAGIEVDDIAKRLIDYGFHAPTVSFPVPGTLMIEPTESESKVELDRFCDAMIAIRNEIRDVESGKASKDNNVLKHAPYTAESLMTQEWNYSFTREQAAYPAPWLKEHKFWPYVGRVDNAYGDRNLVCTCPSIEEYES